MKVKAFLFPKFKFHYMKSLFLLNLEREVLQCIELIQKKKKEIDYLWIYIQQRRYHPIH